MEMHRKEPSLTLSISFDDAIDVDEDDSISTVYQSPLPHEAANDGGAGDDDNCSSDDFEFAFALRDPEAELPISADELFSGGWILPAYPVFNRDLLLLPAEELTPADEGVQLRRLLKDEKDTASDTVEVEAVGEYCPWRPKSSPQRCRKSASTGSARQWSFRNLFMGRSHSDGKEKLLLIETSQAPGKEKKQKLSAKGPALAKEKKQKPDAMGVAVAPKKRNEGRGTMELDMVTAHRLYYGKRKQVTGMRRLSFLPYRQGLLGFFTSANGLKLTHYPF